MIDTSFVITYQQLIIAYHYKFFYNGYVSNLYLCVAKLSFTFLLWNFKKVFHAKNVSNCDILILSNKKELFICRESDDYRISIEAYVNEI